MVTVGYGHGVQHSQWSHSMANINFYKSHDRAFFAGYHHIRDIEIAKLMTLKILVNVVMYNLRSEDIQLQIPDFLSNSNSKVCTITHPLRDIRKSNKMQKV